MKTGYKNKGLKTDKQFEDSSFLLLHPVHTSSQQLLQAVIKQAVTVLGLFAFEIQLNSSY